MKRTYVAYHGHTEFTFESEHRAGSAANMEDAKRAARSRFGKPARGYEHIIDGIHLREKVRKKKTDEKPIAYIRKDLTLTEEEKAMVSDAIAAGKITCVGTHLYGTLCVLSIKDAHGWSGRDLDRAILDEFFYKRKV